MSAFSIEMPSVTLRTCSFMHKLQIMAVSFHCFGFIFTFLILRWLYKFTLSLSLHLSINIFSVFSPLHHYCYPVSVFVLKTCKPLSKFDGPTGMRDRMRDTLSVHRNELVSLLSRYIKFLFQNVFVGMSCPPRDYRRKIRNIFIS